MTPTPGRTVFYHFMCLARRDTGAAPYTQELRTRPAIVTSVGNGDLVNLHVFFEPGDGVLRDESEEPFRENVPFIQADDLDDLKSGTWSWPPRVT